MYSLDRIQAALAIISFTAFKQFQQGLVTGRFDSGQCYAGIESEYTRLHFIQQFPVSFNHFQIFGTFKNRINQVHRFTRAG